MQYIPLFLLIILLHSDNIRALSWHSCRNFGNTLSCRGNDLKGKIPTDHFPGIENIKKLDLTASNIGNLEGYDAPFKKFTQLQDLSLAGNELAIIPENVFDGLEDTLELLDISSNRLKKLPLQELRKLKKLFSLQMNNNTIGPDFQYSTFSDALPRLRVLEMANQGIVNIIGSPFMGMPILEILVFNGILVQKLQKEHFKGLSKMTYISFDENSVKEIDVDVFEHAPHLNVVIQGVTNGGTIPIERYLYIRNLKELRFNKGYPSCCSNTWIRDEITGRKRHWGTEVLGLDQLSSLKCTLPVSKTETKETRFSQLQQHQCDIDGRWSGWSSWSSCSKTCNKGIKRRHRLCDNPLPSGIGKKCEGRDEESAACFRKNCNVKIKILRMKTSPKKKEHAADPIEKQIDKKLKRKRKLTLPIIIAISVAAFIILSYAAVSFWLSRKRKNRRLVRPPVRVTKSVREKLAASTKRFLQDKSWFSHSNTKKGLPPMPFARKPKVSNEQGFLHPDGKFIKKRPTDGLPPLPTTIPHAPQFENFYEQPVDSSIKNIQRIIEQKHNVTYENTYENLYAKPDMTKKVRFEHRAEQGRKRPESAKENIYLQPEHVYDDPDDYIHENIYDDPDEYEAEHIYDDPDEDRAEHIYDDPDEDGAEHIYDDPDEYGQPDNATVQYNNIYNGPGDNFYDCTSDPDQEYDEDHYLLATDDKR